MSAFQTFVDLLRSRSEAHPERLAYVFLQDGEEETERRTYGELDARARALAVRLRERGAVPGDRVLLLFPPGLDFVDAFLGCLYAGTVAVPCYPPRPGREQPRLKAILEDAGARFALGTAAITSKLESLAATDARIADLERIVAEAVPSELAERWERPPVSDLGEDTLAFLQYTSGSTATPKGVMVTHGNLLFMEGLIAEAFEQDERSVVVGWLPVYHDMGLIGNVLQPLWLGASCVLMSPVAFLRRPRRWLEAISRYRGTTSGGPNFAYELCAERIGEEERRGLDLSSWRVAFNGAEPVRASTLERFAEAFAGAGFRRQAFRPCYGLAEATLLVSGAPAAEEPIVLEVGAEPLEQGRIDTAGEGRSRRLVGCGTVPAEQPVAVVDPDTRELCEADRIGEIWVRGSGVAAGYWNRPEETAETFGALLGSTGPWLRTGDLGFIQGGSLFVTGRLKDLIILRGRNHYPQDLELTAERAAPGLFTGAGAAFAVEVEGDERLVVVQELAPRSRPDEAALQETAAAIRRAIAEEHEVQVHEVLLVKAGTIPKTSSGKIQRRLCRSMYLEGTLEPVGRSKPSPASSSKAPLPADLEGWLRHKAAQVLGVPVEEVDPERPLIELGLDSLAVIELGHAAEMALGVTLPPGALLEGASVADLARRDLTPRPPLPSHTHLPGEGAPPPKDTISQGRGFPLSRAGGLRWERGPGGEVSLGQRALWFLHRLRPESVAYNLGSLSRVHGDISNAGLRAFFQRMIDRHPALRTTFHMEGEEVVQRVQEGMAVPFEEIDASGWTEEEFRARLEETAWRRFDLERGPLFRVALFQRPGERILVLEMHHIVSDFGSLASSVSEGREGNGGAGEFAVWQEQALTGPEGERWLGYWRERLAGLPELDLPADRVKPENAPEKAGARWREIGPETLAEIKALARSRGVTLYVALLAAFQALLHRYTGQEDFALGSPVSGRPPGFGSTFGYFTNAVVLRADLSAEPSFAELVDRTRRRVAEALDHQHLPLTRLVEHLGAGVEPFRSMFVLHRPPADAEALVSLTLGEAGGRLRLDGFELEPLPLAPRAGQFDVTLAAGERRGALGMQLVYDALRFEATTAARWLEHLANLLSGALERPDASVSELPLLSPWERHQVLLEVNDTSEPDLSWTLLHEGFQRQAGRTPDAVALIDGERRLTYQELYARASELAGQLRRMGIGPETVVGVRLPRTAELIVTLLGVLEAGAAYLPLDPAYPEERIGFMVEDAGAALVIESPALPSPPGPLSRHPSLPPRERGRDLAYLIYTSGSTGRPKGVAIEHASAVRFVAWASQAFSAEELRGVLASTSISFDLSIFEIFVPLSLGGTVILAENALALPGLPARDEVTLINTVPSAIAALLDTGGLPESVRTVNLAGEPLRRSLADKVLATGVRLWDLYGPSEDTTYSTGSLIEPGQPEEPLIGWPVAGSRAYVVDRGGRPLPLGVPGELWLGGGGLARGYLGRPALTAEKFIPDPFGETPGVRVYRTGDLVRRRFDGALDYLGRIDHQVKIRGFRIELGEVETGLLAVPFVREAVVVAREGTLVGYVALIKGAPDPAEEALRESLRQRLPAVFVPAVLIVLDALPRTPNGKVDRKALPEPERLRGTSAEPPSGPVEETLATLWEGLLGRSGIGRTDRFFDLGGHSLLASRVASRVREAFGVELPLAAFFEEPTLAGLARRIERARGADPALAEPIPRVSREAPLPLSFAQQRLWFLDRLEPWSATYNMPVALRLRGEIDKAALERALTGIVRRHEALRTTFHEAEGGPVQRMTPPGPFSLPVEDAGAAAFQRLEEEAVRPFDLENGPVFRALLLRIADRDHLLLANLHHIVSDGWSLGVLVRELSVLYAAFREDRPSPLAELPLQSADWASWQRLRLAGEPLETGLAWWREALRGLPERLDLPVDRPRRPVERRRGGRIPVRLDPGLTRDLADLGRREGVTLFTVLLAGFQALLGRWSGQEDLAVGSPVAGRTRVEIEELIGFFVNTLVLRVDLSGEPEIRELLRRSRSMLLAAHEHQHVPFEKLVEELAPVRELGRTPLFEAMLSFQNGAPEPPRLPGLETELVPVGTATAKLDLEIQLAERGGALEGAVEYDADLFETATIDRFLDHFVLLLRGMVEAPAARVADLPLLAEAERGQLLRWNATTVERPAEASLPVLFAAQADRTPERVAVRFEGNELTYGELDERSNRLAWHLRGRGVGPDVVVGVALERSLELIVALYAVHKASGAFLPLDLSHPDERLGRMLADSGAAVVVTVERYRERFVDFRTLCLDTDSSSLAAAPSTRPPLEIQGDHLAYVIFTSGSTGAPKGAMNTHAAIANRLLWMQDTYRLDATDGVLQKTPATFDVSVWEFFWPLLVGARLVVARPEGHRDPAYLLRTVVDEGITVLHFVPSMLQIFLEESGVERAASVRQVMASGEALPAELARRFFERLPGARLHNLYGPTEAAVDVTAWTCEPGAAGAGVPIGRPIANVQIRILDRGLRLVPIGSPGELCIAGAGLARGYLGRADLTAERFVPDPGSVRPGGRLYRTGDLARWWPDGVLEYLGRIDHQVKIRGVRIEPGEIEAALAAFPAVRDGVVLAREDRPGDRRLVAYVVPSGGELRVEELRDFLRQRLPDALVPAAFVELDALPLSANGKLDRKALARIAPSVREPEAFELPAGPAEERLAAIWSEVLGAGRIGRRDGFFERGGHSLLAAQVVTRIRRVFGVEIPLRSLFEAPTLAVLAGRIAAAEEGSAESPLAGIAGDAPAPLSFAQQRLWFLAQLDPASSVYNIPAALQLRGALDVHALRRALLGIARRHETLRTTFRLEGDEPRQIIGEVADIPLPLIDLRGLGPDGEAEAARRAVAEAARPFDLREGPVFRALLLRLSEGEHRLLANMHHIASDGWSLGVFTRELAALYANAPLPELPVRYRDFAVWQRTRRSDERDLAFWREELRGLPAGLDLPADHPRPPVQTYRGAVRPFAVGGETTEGLRRLARGTGGTLFMALLAGFQALLARWSGQEDLAVGTPVAGRSRVELEGLIGFFVNTLVLRGDLSGNPDSRTLIRRARERFLAAQAHQDLPFEKLVEELKPERNLARPPLFQVLLVLQNTPRTPLVLPGLEVTSEAVETGTAKVELQLTLEERDGGLAGTLDYNRDLFEAPTMDRFLCHLGALLAAAVAEPERPAGELPIFSTAERSQLVAWNATAVRYPEGATLPALFAAQVDRTPENVAVRFEGESLTYQELDERSSRLAWHLRGLGVGPDVVVAVALERSLELIVALYAVHKAGGAYLPLDLSHPDERLGRMVGDSGAAVVVTLEREAPRFAGPHVLRLDSDHATIASESPTRPPLEIQGDHLAYVIFTSGSTGAPKGAMNTHAAIANRLLWMQDAYRLDGSDRVLQKTPSTFDVSVWEFFWPLLIGARLVVARPEGHRDPSYLLRTLIEEEITVLHFVPSMLHVFLEEPGVERATSVRQVMASGEALPADLARRFFERLPGARLHNLYGPTEAAVDVTAWTCEPGSTEAVIPIGRPIANLEIRILDRLARPLPMGAPGELCIGGAGLARGYLGRPDLTADRFIPDPERSGDRLYRTGDLARWRADGWLEYLGRIDHQVKIRGMRIEPGEIESALASFPAVREAVVLAREDRPGHKMLVAYLVPRLSPLEGSLPLDELRGFLRERLPEPLVPSAFVLLDALPLSANGKLDRRSLPAPEGGPAAAPAVLPRTETEKAIAAAWREALGLESVGVDDSFFDIGGHSLLVVQVHRRLVPLFPDLAVVDLFRYPTVSALAGYLSKEKVDQISLEQTRERAGERTDRARRQRDLRRQARGR